MLSKLMSGIKLSFGKVVSVCTKTALTKMVTVGVTLLVAGGAITGIIVYSNSVIEKAPVEEGSLIENTTIEEGLQAEEINKTDETSLSSNEPTPLTTEQSTKLAEETAVAVSKAKEEAKVPLNNGEGTQPVENEPTPPAPTPAPQPVVTHKAAGYNAELTARVNQAILDSRLSCSGTDYNAFKNYIVNGGALPVIDLRSVKSTGEVITASVAIDENSTNLTQYFVQGSSIRNVIGANISAINYGKVSCDGNGVANITVYHLLVVPK